MYSICSANRAVIKAGMEQAHEDDSLLLIESTSNQVDQFGGYTGMKPRDFVKFIRTIASEQNFPLENILLGGDHLGPNRWQKESSKQALKKAGDLVNAYVEAGYQKIHLDTSMHCLDDQGDRSKPLDDEIVAERAAELCAIAEKTWSRLYKDSFPPLYIIGTEVPVPGGATENEESVKPTNPEDVKRTIDVTMNAFRKKGIQSAAERIVGVVVQPGVEFGNNFVVDYSPEKSRALSEALEQYQNLVYEAHSTDYQNEEALTEMINNKFCILKVGPWLTYAYREALFALNDIEEEMIGTRHAALSNLKKIIDTVMMEDPKYWTAHYDKEESEYKRLLRRYSYSDRIRYYWGDKRIKTAITRLLINMKQYGIEPSLLHQYLPEQYEEYRKKRIRLVPEEIIKNKIKEVIRIYSRSCGLYRETNRNALLH